MKDLLNAAICRAAGFSVVVFAGMSANGPMTKLRFIGAEKITIPVERGKPLKAKQFNRSDHSSTSCNGIWDPGLTRRDHR
jgi:hypothetical protein